MKNIWKKIKSFFNNLVEKVSSKLAVLSLYGESPSDIPLKKDGTPDKRYTKNK